MAKTKELVDLLPEMRAFIARNFKTQTVCAENWGCSRAFLSAVITGRKSTPDWILEKIGVERTVVYVRK